jgi:hypothetical protein
MRSSATTVKKYLAALPKDRREILQAVREVILENLNDGYEEGIQYGMIGYNVPHSLYPPGYHCDPKQSLPFAGLASQKNYMSLYLMCIYCSPTDQAWFERALTKSGKKIDMGKCCLRFKSLDNLPLDVVAKAIRRLPVKKFVRQYEKAIGTRSQAKKQANS